MLQRKKSKPEPDDPQTDLGRRLHDIWAEIHSWTPPRSWRDFGSYVEKRALTEGEWDEVKAAIASGYPATIVPHGWVTGVALVVYEPGYRPFPGVEAEALPVMQITGYQLPGNHPKDHSKKQRFDPSVERPTPGGVWEIFSALCGTPENLAALQRENLDPPSPIGRYQY